MRRDRRNYSSSKRMRTSKKNLGANNSLVQRDAVLQIAAIHHAHGDAKVVSTGCCHSEKETFIRPTDVRNIIIVTDLKVLLPLRLNKC